MAYLVPSEFVAKMVDAGESKVFMSTRDTLIRAYAKPAFYFTSVTGRSRLGRRLNWIFVPFLNYRHAQKFRGMPEETLLEYPDSTGHRRCRRCDRLRPRCSGGPSKSWTMEPLPYCARFFAEGAAQ